MAIFDLYLIYFWGMARLGKLTSPIAKGELDSRTLVFLKDVSWEIYSGETVAVITAGDAKTCKPGEYQLFLSVDFN